MDDVRVCVSGMEGGEDKRSDLTYHTRVGRIMFLMGKLQGSRIEAGDWGDEEHRIMDTRRIGGAVGSSRPS